MTITLSVPVLSHWAVAASLVASAHTVRIREPVADAMASAALANPVTDSDDGVKTMLAYEVSLAWYEGHNELSPHGSNDGGSSFCWAQVNLPHGARTLEGWSGSELKADPVKCATVAVRIIKSSVTAPRAPSDCPLCVYARGYRWLGSDSVMREARRLSSNRVSLARKLLRDVAFTP